MISKTERLRHHQRELAEYQRRERRIDEELDAMGAKKRKKVAK
jgi:hypothetical protein